MVEEKTTRVIENPSECNKGPKSVDCEDRGYVEALQTPYCPNGFLYTVRPGDTFFSIAQRFGVTVAALTAANPQITDPSRLTPGQIVCVPTGGGPGPTPSCPNGFLYTVRPGDTFFSIGQQFGVSVAALRAANPQVTDPSRLTPGQVVCVPTGGPGPTPSCPNGFLYTVRPGDTFFSIGQQFGVSVAALTAANPQVTDPSRIVPGQVICVPSGGGGTPGCSGFLYTVRPGDSFYLIAQRYGVSLSALIAANPQVSDPSRIFPGQVICVPSGGGGGGTPGCNGFLYTVRPGDSMYFIATRYGVSLSAIIAANPQIGDPSLIYPGQVICVPTGGFAALALAEPEQEECLKAYGEPSLEKQSSDSMIQLLLMVLLFSLLKQ